MAHTDHTSSYYAASANPTPDRPALQGSHETDVCVIGAGYTGVSTALFLLEQGFKVTILEAARVGFGASGRNGGQIVNSYSRDIDVIERTVGKEQARLLGEMAFEGARIIRDRVARYNINCDLKDGGVFAAVTAKQMQHLESQKALWERYGHSELELMDARRIREVVDTESYVGGMLDMSGGHIHPLNLVPRHAGGPGRASGRPHRTGAGHGGFCRRGGQRLSRRSDPAAGSQIDALRYAGDHHRAPRRVSRQLTSATGLLRRGLQLFAGLLPSFR